MNVLLIKSGKVDNCISADSVARAQQFYPEHLCLEQTGAEGIGYGYADGVFTEPPPPAPVIPADLTHLEFRRLFTSTEQEFCDELEATFESNALLSAAQKRTLRTGYKNFYAASKVDLADPAIPPVLGLYVALGILDAARPAQILMGVQP
ncbi:MAG: hypothetical protein IPN53_05165 [Comamonadaceae bacterium]|nr:hypothetical protein [Comamonadaceae bacterium]